MRDDATFCNFIIQESVQFSNTVPGHTPDLKPSPACLPLPACRPRSNRHTMVPFEPMFRYQPTLDPTADHIKETVRIWTSLGDSATALLSAITKEEDVVQRADMERVPLIMGAIWLDSWMESIALSFEAAEMDTASLDDFLFYTHLLVEALAYKKTDNSKKYAHQLVDIATRAIM